MKIAANTIVSIRYQMKNGKGEVLEDTMEGEPVNYLHGAGYILPALEADLSGLSAGDKKSIAISKESGFLGVDDDFYFDVVIDDVRMATDDELISGSPAESADDDDCGPGCCC